MCEAILEFAQACRVIVTLPASPAEQPLKNGSIGCAAANDAAAGGTPDVVGDDVCSESSDGEEEEEEERIAAHTTTPSSAALAATATALAVGNTPSIGLIRLMRQPDGFRRTRASLDGSTPRTHAQALITSQPDVLRLSMIRSARIQPAASRKSADQRALVARKRLVRSNTTPNPTAAFASTGRPKQR